MGSNFRSSYENRGDENMIDQIAEHNIFFIKNGSGHPLHPEKDKTAQK